MVLTKEEEKILKSIKVNSENNPENPEFPPEKPKFPATPTYKIKVPEFSNVWLKDESYNPTGTHKDRMAWEMVVTYRDFLLSKKRGQIAQLPKMSVISFGSAAIAIQTMLNKYNLPNLKVLLDKNFVDKKDLEYMKRINCEIYETDLSKKPLSWSEILLLTDNQDGIEITSSEALDPTTRFYDWLSYEIINNSPDYCFVPFGTGNLYENILNINKKEVSSQFNNDPRFKGNIEILQQCNFMGATTSNPNTKAHKLYSPHLPFVHYGEQWIRFYRYAGYCGAESNVHLVKEQFIDEAMKILEKNNVKAESSSAAGLALMLQLRNKLPRNKKMLIVSTGKVKIPQ